MAVAHLSSQSSRGSKIITKHNSANDRKVCEQVSETQPSEVFVDLHVGHLFSRQNQRPGRNTRRALISPALIILPH